MKGQSLINIPNLITCCNLLCGCFAIYCGLQSADGMIGLACWFIIGGAVFDFFDGMTARALHISGPIGKELDSLADCVTFGVAPSVLCWHILNSYVEGSGHIDAVTAVLPLCAFIMAAFSALRLAKFNCDERQTLSFIGLPTPANALLWIGLVYLNQMEAVHEAVPELAYILLMLVCCYLLISEIPMFSLKIKPGHMGLKENLVRYSFLVITVVLLVVFAIFHTIQASLALIILLYILFSILSRSKA